MDCLVVLQESHLGLQKHFKKASVDVKLGITQPGAQPVYEKSIQKTKLICFLK